MNDTNYDIQDAIFEAIADERDRQDKLWGVQNHLDLTWNAILVEEVGETSQEVLTQSFGAAAKGHGSLEEELIQVAAVATAWLECLFRRNSPDSV